MASFKQQIMEPNKNALIVDGMNLAFRWKHQGKLDFKQDYINTVKSLAQSYDCSKIIIAGDQGSSGYRKFIDPQYKANRAEKYKDQTEQEKEDIKLFFEEFERTLEALGLRKIGQVKEHEATPNILGMVAKVSHLVSVEEA